MFMMIVCYVLWHIIMGNLKVWEIYFLHQLLAMLMIFFFCFFCFFGGLF